MRCFIITLLITIIGHCQSLVIQGDDISKTYSLKKLRQRQDLVKIKIDNPPAFKEKSFQTDAVPMKSLLKEAKIDADALMRFQALDGYAAPIPVAPMMSESGPQAYIAIEDDSWPKLKKNGKSAGPFFLVWVRKDEDKVPTGWWPYAVVKFEVMGTIEQEYPKIFPQKSAKRDVWKGFQIFQSQCFSCHKINQQGQADLGPDLNIPLNPTEYFVEKYLRMYIKNPQDMRTWSNSAMPGVDLNDEEMNQLISYLKHMAKNRD